MAFFEKPFKANSRKSMVEYLSNHFRYYLMQPWNRITTWANIAKLYSLDLPKDMNEAAYAFLLNDIDRTPWDDEIQTIIQEFEALYNGNYTICTNGRSSGYLVLVPKRRSSQELDVADIEDPATAFSDIKATAILVRDFDRACDQIRDALIQFCRDYRIETVIATQPVTYQRMVRKDGVSED